MDRGRPTDFRDEYCEDIVEFMRNGKSLTAYAAKIGHHRQILYDWSKRHANFQDAIKRAIDLAETYWETQLEDAALMPAQTVNTTAMIFLMKARFKTYREQIDMFTSDEPYEEPESFRNNLDDEEGDLDVGEG